ncbi:MAG: M14 family metallopeptidase [Phycisphaeraceae bacterium]|nr:M14 family metallopeptidase [Phycisphaeraceae bacterium]
MRQLIPRLAAAAGPLALLGCAATTPTSVTTTRTAPAELQTAAERTAAYDTSTCEEVAALVTAIAQRSPIAIESSLGRSFENRNIPMLVIADPPVATPRAAHNSGKLIVYEFGGIHSGEACGKEALLQLARDIALHPDEPENRKLLDNLILLVVPLYNPDGDARRSPGNRPGQVGPAGGMGQRANAQGLDLNRDHVKLEAPETRAQVNLLNTWDPHLIIDTHTTDGSYHRMDLTYAPPLNPSGDPALLGYAQDIFLPRVEQRVLDHHNLVTAPYGNFDDEKTVWATYSANPMFGGPYRGLRNRVSILSEAYAYATFAERIRSTELFVRECLDLAAEQRQPIIALEQSADANSRPAEIGIRHDYAPPTTMRTIPGWLETRGDSDHMIPTGAHREYEVDLLDRFAPTRSVSRPVAYLIPPGMDAITDQLRLHGIRVETVTATFRLPVEVDTITAIDRAERPFQGHHYTTIETARNQDVRTIGDGWTRIPTDQPLGTLLVYLMEPQSGGGLAAWGFFDPWIEPDGQWPVLRQTD